MTALLLCEVGWRKRNRGSNIWSTWLVSMGWFLDVHCDLMVTVVLCVSVLFELREPLGSAADLLPFLSVSG